MKRLYRHTAFFFAIIVSVLLGYLLGLYSHGRIANRLVQHNHFELSKSILLSDSVCDFLTGNNVKVQDTLALKEHNLLVFWSPTCSYSKEFFLHKLNENVVGIYCIPITDDIDYLKYYIKKQNIRYPQLMLRGSYEVESVSASSIVATPTFVVVDNKGKTLAQYVGTKEIDKMITLLYQGI